MRASLRRDAERPAAMVQCWRLDLKGADVTGQANATFNAKSDERLSANCPAVVRFSSAGAKKIPPVRGCIVNLSVSGCLVSSDTLPWSNAGSGAGDITASDVDGRNCRVHLPWTKQHFAGTVRRVGGYILGIEFQQKLPGDLVREIARLEPGQFRRTALIAAPAKLLPPPDPTRSA